MKAKFGVIVILTGIAVGAISYWPIPYEEINFLNPIRWVVVGSLCFVGAFICRYFIKDLPMRLALYLAFGVVLSVIFRILYDSFFVDSTSHNLAPIEIGIALAQSLPLAFLSAYLAVGLKKAKKE